MSAPLSATGASRPPDRGTASASLASAAKAFAETFSWDSPDAEQTRVDPETTQLPTWVRRGAALHETWEQKDLGSTQVQKWTVEGQRVWALRTTTDGDDSFLELFDARGKLLASGVGGFKDDGNGGFKPIIRWDSVPGAERESLASISDAPANAAFSESLHQAQDPSSALAEQVSLAEIKGSTQKLLDNELNTSSLDLWENAFLHRTLADPKVDLTRAARAYAENLSDFYTDRTPATLKRVQTPDSASALGISGPSAPEILVAQANVTRHPLPVRMNELVALTQEAWNLFASGARPRGTAELERALKEAGVPDEQLARALEKSGATAPGAKVFSAKPFAIDDDWMPSRRPGDLWFTASEDGKKLRALHLRPAGSPVTDPQAVVIAAFRSLGLPQRPFTVASSYVDTDATVIDLELKRPDGALSRAELRVPSDGGEPQIALKTSAPMLDPDVKMSLENALFDSHPFAQVVGFVRGDSDSEYLAAHRPGDGFGPVQLTQVTLGSSGSATTRPFSWSSVPVSKREELAKSIALSCARHHAEERVAHGQGADLAELEVGLRVGWATESDLEAVSPAESPVGFDPSTELYQFMLPSVWGDNAVIVTLKKDGGVRVEDFN